MDEAFIPTFFINKQLACLNEDITMNNTISTMKTFIYITLAGFFCSSLAYANAPHSVTALEHVVMAQAHNELGHKKDVQKHLAEAIQHAGKSQKMHADAHEHATEAVTHLKEVVKHNTLQHTMSGIHSNAALHHAEMAEKTHGEAHQHIAEVLKHLKEAETHAKAGHKEKVAEHLHQVVEHIEDTL